MTYDVQDSDGNQALHYNRLVKRHDGWAVHNRDTGSCEVVINSGVLGTGENTIDIQSGAALLGGSDTSISQQTVSVPASGSDPRKDVIVLRSDGSAGREAGYPEPIQPSGDPLETSERPAPPDLAGLDVVPLAVVVVPANATDITADNLVDIRPSADYSIGSLNGDDPSTYTQSDVNETITGDWAFEGSVSGVSGTGGAPTDASYVTLSSEAGLDNETSHADIAETNRHPPASHDNSQHSTNYTTQTAFDDHETATSGVHGVGSSTIAAHADIDDHAGTASGVHGVGDSSVASASDITDHAGTTSGVHGVGSSTVASQADLDSQTPATATVVDSYTASNFERVLADAGDGTLTVTLPPVANDLDVVIKKIDGSDNAVTIATPGSETIDGQSELSITNQYTSRPITSDGSNYFII